MKIGAIIPARMSSQRLPGKVLLPLAGKPVLKYVVEAARRAVPRVVVATSLETSDDPIAKFCSENNVPCFRGSLSDVAGRFLRALEHTGWEAAVRVSADSPLLDWRLIKLAVIIFEPGGIDVVTNVYPRTFPKGQSVEVVAYDALRRAYPNMSLAEREHVTSYFYANSGRWQVKNFVSGHDWSSIRLCVDTPEDMAMIEFTVRRLRRPHWEYQVEELVP